MRNLKKEDYRMEEGKLLAVIVFVLIVSIPDALTGPHIQKSICQVKSNQIKIKK